MPGFSITTLLLPTGSESDAPDSSLLLSLIDEPANVPGWKWAANVPPLSTDKIATSAKKEAAAPLDIAVLRAEDPKAFNAAVERACTALADAEPDITRYDNIAGDGDCGLTLKAGGACACLSIPCHCVARLC